MAPGASGRGGRQQRQQEQQQQAEQKALVEPKSLVPEKAKGSSEGSTDAPILYSMENLQANMKAVNYGRSFMSIIAGVVAGILGLTGLWGLLCFAAVMLLSSLAFLLKTGFSPATYFHNPSTVTVDGFFGGAMSFVLFWTLAYDIVHIF